jgi:hypothetical protein
LDRPVELALFANQTVVVLPLPEGPGSPQDTIRFSRGVVFPTSHHVRELLPRKQAKDHVYLIRHHAPCHEPVSFPIPKAKRVCDQFADPWITKEARTDSSIEVFFDHLRTVLCDKGFLIGQQIRSRAFRCIEYAVTLGDSFQHLLRQRVCEMKRNEIKSYLSFPMGQPTALPDSYLTEARLHRALHGAHGRAGPLCSVCHQMGILRLIPGVRARTHARLPARTLIT